MANCRKSWMVFLILFFAFDVSAQVNEMLGMDRIDAALSIHSNGDLSQFLMQETADSGAKYVKFWVPWKFMDLRPPLSSKPKEENGYLVAPGIRMNGWHKYYVKGLDLAVAEAQKQNLKITLGIHGPPAWPRGEKVCEYDLGTYEPCGIILQSHSEIFKNALFDFSYHMALRYPEIEYWILYNEPNLPYAFLPQEPWPGGTLLNAYMDLVYWPMADGLRANGNDIKLVGPEITLLNVGNVFGGTNWKEDWIEQILQNYPNHFDVLSVHSYAVDATQTLKKMEIFQEILAKYPHATQRVWLTEFNFGTEKEKLTQTDLYKFVNILWMLKHQWWEKSYLFSFLGSVVYEEYWRFGKPRPIFFWLQRLFQN